MRRTILTLASAAAVAAAGVAATPQKAEAVVWWVAPAIIGGTILGVGAGAAVANTNAYNSRGEVYVQPTAQCHIMRERLPDGRSRRVRVCD